jgi:hypothetical protein
MYHAGTHNPYYSYTWRILYPRNPGQIRPGVGTPVAAECNDLWLKIIIHILLSPKFDGVVESLYLLRYGG